MINCKRLLIAASITTTLLLIISLIIYRTEKNKILKSSDCLSGKRFQPVVLNEMGSDPKPVKTIYVNSETYQVLSQSHTLYLFNSCLFSMEKSLYIYFIGDGGLENDFSVACTSKGIGTLICRKDWSIAQYCRNFNRTGLFFNIKPEQTEDYVFDHLFIYFLSSGKTGSIYRVTAKTDCLIADSGIKEDKIGIPYSCLSESTLEEISSFRKNQLKSDYQGEMLIAAEDLDNSKRLLLYKVSFRINNEGKISISLKKVDNVKFSNYSYNYH